jgi:hypothetical protein
MALVKPLQLHKKKKDTQMNLMNCAIFDWGRFYEIYQNWKYRKSVNTVNQFLISITLTDAENGLKRIAKTKSNCSKQGQKIFYVLIVRYAL